MKHRLLLVWTGLFGAFSSAAQPALQTEAKALAWATDQLGYRSGALARIRLGLEREAGACAWRVAWNLEALGGEVVRSPQGRARWLAPSGVDAVRLEWTAQSARVLGRLRLHRLRFGCFGDRAELRTGRIRIAWGVGRIWSLLDRFHASPITALEPDEVAGADGVDARLRLSQGELRAAFAPGRAARRSRDRLAFGWQAATIDWDFGVVAMRIGDERLFGFAAAGNLGDWAWHAEAAQSRWKTQRGSRMLVGIDGRSDLGPIDWGAEVLWDETPGRIPPEPLLLLGLARWQLGMHLRWELHPLWTLTGWLLRASSRDRAVQLALQHSAAEDWQLEGFVRWARASHRALYGSGRLIAVSVAYFH